MRIAFFIAAVLRLTSSVQADFVLVDSKARITRHPHGQPKKHDDTDGEVKMSCVPFSLSRPLVFHASPLVFHFALLFRGNLGRFNLLQPSFDSEIVAAEFAGFQAGEFFAWGSADANVRQGCAPGMQSSAVE